MSDALEAALAEVELWRTRALTATEERDAANTRVKSVARQVGELTAERDAWRVRAESAEQEVERLTEENAAVQAEVMRLVSGEDSGWVRGDEYDAMRRRAESAEAALAEAVYSLGEMAWLLDGLPAAIMDAPFRRDIRHRAAEVLRRHSISQLPPTQQEAPPTCGEHVHVWRDTGHANLDTPNNEAGRLLHNKRPSDGAGT